MGFTEFFKAATCGLAAFPYQVALAEIKELPWALNAPTGAGKTAAAVLGWLWRRRHHPDLHVRKETPRRLVYCLPMRVLVEQTLSVTREWLANLGALAESPGEPGKVGVFQLLGGEVENDWDAWPETDAILVGTQDQLLSRALNRGYALSRYRWPMQFGLLNSDCLWVLDEVQLMGPGLATSLQLQAFRNILGGAGPTSSLWMSATIQPAQLLTVDSPSNVLWANHTLSLGSQDREHPSLAPRLTATKPLSSSGLLLNREKKSSYAAKVAHRALDLHQEGTLTLVILNQVARAQAVAAEFGCIGGRDAPELVLLHSRYRRAERQALQAQLSSDLPAAGRIVVATQTVEAGVDLSARVMLTELAPWVSLVQRFGRCNRRGEWSETDGCQVQWLDVDPETEGAPYEAADLRAARKALTGLKDASIATLEQVEVPSRSALTQVLRRRDLLELFDTTPDLAGNDIDVSPYIRDSDDLDVSVLWRNLADETSLLAAPEPAELCPVRLPLFRQFLTDLHKRDAKALVWEALTEKWVPLRQEALRPGLVLLLDTKAGGYDPNLGWWPDAKKVPPVVSAVAALPALPNEGYDDDHLTTAGQFVTLAEHLAHVVSETEALLELLAIDESAGAALRKAAGWHDVGKAHTYFQDRLLGALPQDDPRRVAGPWAKSDGAPGAAETGSERPHFRHELASALALLQHGGDDLAAYLIASHHGKVRMSLRSLPGERIADGDRRFARGVWEGDTLPPLVLGDGTEVPETVLSLQLMELGFSAAEPSWLERMLTLRDRYGPFHLAYLEALLRAADWRASAKEREGNG